MSHKEQRLYCEGVRRKYPNFFNDVSVLDVGSLDINGNNRYLFASSCYTGIDITFGKNVDIAKPVHLLTEIIYYFDVIICTEMLEHDKYFYDSLKNMVRLLRPRGLLIITAATIGRLEHGTYKNNPQDSPATNDYYKNITLEMLVKGLSLKKYIFSDYEISINGFDIRFYGIKNSI